MLKGKHIILGITGSIAAYKSAVLCGLLVSAGAEVRVIMTPLAKQFITPLTMATLSQHPILVDFFNPENGEWNSHVRLGEWADLYLIAPASANTMAKMATGVADNLLLTTYLSARCPVAIAPAMDLDMYKHPTTQQNIDKLKGFGNRFIEPTSGFLASGLEGKGRMEEPENIVRELEDYFNSADDNTLTGKKILITAGPTYEKIDPVRFIGNYSSGKMGFALAEECAKRGADVTLVSGPVSLKCYSSRINRIDVESCQQMYEAAVEAFYDSDAAILCAAVADFCPETEADKKIKREKDDLMIRLKPTKDIAAQLGKMKREGQKIVAFALETNDEEVNARRKLERKNADFIVLNSTRNSGTTFRSEDNQITIISQNGKKEYPKKPKSEVAKDIVDELSAIFCV